MDLKATKPIRLVLPEYESVNIVLVGAGGTGSNLITSLGAIALGLKAIGKTCTITIVDHDVVEEKNIGRQLFTARDIGKFKAAALAERLVAAYSVDASSVVKPIEKGMLSRSATGERSNDYLMPSASLSVVIGAVDNPAARRAIHEAVSIDPFWWLDCGNDDYHGQVVMGNHHYSKKWVRRTVSAMNLTAYLPLPSVVYPDLIVDPAKVKADKACAEAVAAGDQSLMINRMIASWAASLLYDFLLGEVTYFGVAVNLRPAGVEAYRLDLETLMRVTDLPESEIRDKPKRVAAK